MTSNRPTSNVLKDEGLRVFLQVLFFQNLLKFEDSVNLPPLTQRFVLHFGEMS